MYPSINLAGKICGFGLIVPYASGMVYTNHTSGASLHSMGLEGVYVPLYRRELPDPTKVLWEFFNKPGFKKNPETADFIDDLIVKCTGLKDLKVDRDRLEEVREAWVPVKLGPFNVDKMGLFEEFSTFDGILVWENSD